MPLEILDKSVEDADVAAARYHVAEFLAEQIRAGASQIELEDIGYQIAAISAVEEDARVDFDRETVATRPVNGPSQPSGVSGPAQSPRPFRRRAKARTYKEKAARDSRPDLKPWPYGTRED